jgi:ketosteroid isomerase-like protein
LQTSIAPARHLRAYARHCWIVRSSALGSAVEGCSITNRTVGLSGSHAIGGERHDRDTLRLWFERLARVLPNLHLKINNIWVKGWPWHTTVFVQWDGTATLLNGDASYFNRGLHVITLRWGRIAALDVFEDSQEVARGLAAQAATGLEEAAAEPIVS